MSIYDRISPIYDWLIISERPFRERALQLLDLQSGNCIVDLGCGTGQSLPEMAAAVGEKGQVIGLDLSPGMLHQSRKKLGQGRVSLLRGTALKLPLEAHSCDALFMSFTLELFDLEEQHQLLAEVRRVLKENGRIGLVTLSTHTPTLMLLLYTSLHEIMPAVIDCRPLDTAPLLTAAGFVVLQQEQQSMFGLPLSIMVAEKKNN
ncbi:MAG: class I SAM-dependent methyltransferase [Candidatus Promineifilaceae bacterium]|jgi:ubiquinone/menaquinone biosynthesis C-methylase UbiE